MDNKKLKKILSKEELEYIFSEIKDKELKKFINNLIETKTGK